MSLKQYWIPFMMVRMKTIMKLEDLKTISQLTDFLSGTQAVAFSIILDKDARYRGFREFCTNFAIENGVNRIKVS